MRRPSVTQGPYLALVGSLIVLPGSLAGQGPSRVTPTIDSIGVDCCTLRVYHQGRTAEGRFKGRPDDSSLLLGSCRGVLCPAPSGQDVRIPLLEETRLEMQSGNHAGFGAVVGGITGAVLFGGLVAFTGSENASAGEILLGSAAGGFGGSLVGLLVGMAFPRWIPVRH